MYALLNFIYSVNTPFLKAIDTIGDTHKINTVFTHKIHDDGKINFRIRDIHKHP
ncbi:hypothetical protein [Candidatus Uabimicrobium amorphum]|uniref:hypothetical protein n=1 Tax=Uabimicrobium amorphum TaxID=2596890 RepID=UPI001566A047|nr:hypothetical protein [Candidatus Uabimicrobium amorphum]